MKATKKEIIMDLIEQARRFRFCGPCDDPEAQTAVTMGYRYLVTQFKRLAGPILAEAESTRLNAIDVQPDDLYSAYDAKAELDALLPDIEATLELLDDAGFPAGANLSIVGLPLITRLEKLESGRVDVTSLVRMCREIACF
jgi:hypothetical protein